MVALCMYIAANFFPCLLYAQSQLPHFSSPCPLYSSFLPTHVITMNTDDINMPESSFVEHNTAISPYQHWWISSVASWKWKVQQ
jgi:hypothetical protein